METKEGTIDDLFDEFDTLGLDEIFKKKWDKKTQYVVADYLLDRFENGKYNYKDFYYAFHGFDLRKCKWLHHAIIGITHYVISTKGNEDELIGFLHRCNDVMDLDIVTELISACDYDMFCFILKVCDDECAILETAYKYSKDRLKVIVEYYSRLDKYKDGICLIERYHITNGSCFDVINMIIEVFDVDIIKLRDETSLNRLKKQLNEIIDNQV